MSATATEQEQAYNLGVIYAGLLWLRTEIRAEIARLEDELGDDA